MGRRRSSHSWAGGEGRPAGSTGTCRRPSVRGNRHETGGYGEGARARRRGPGRAERAPWALPWFPVHRCRLSPSATADCRFLPYLATSPPGQGQVWGAGGTPEKGDRTRRIAGLFPRAPAGTGAGPQVWVSRCWGPGAGEEGAGWTRSCLLGSRVTRRTLGLFLDQLEVSHTFAEPTPFLTGKSDFNSGSKMPSE